MVIPTTWFSAAAQNADPSRYRYLDRCTHCTAFVPCRIGHFGREARRGSRAVRAARLPDPRWPALTSARAVARGGFFTIHGPESGPRRGSHPERKRAIANDDDEGR